MTKPQKRAGGARRRTTHSLEAIVSEAVALLDEAGESALTFRALAARLGGGVASIYWYVDNKDELLDRATDFVFGEVLRKVTATAPSDDPIADIRSLAVAVFGAIVQRPWLGSFLMRDTGVQENSLAIYERLGQQVMRLGLGPRDSFHAVSAVMGFVIGTATDLGQQPPQEVVDGSLTRDDYLARHAAQWRALDDDEFPFVHYIADEFEQHQDVEQFEAGLDLILAGLGQQAGR